MTAVMALFRPGRKLNSFSLVEMLVALALVAIIGVLLAMVLDHAMQIWRRSVARMEMQREAQVALEAIADDFSQTASHLSNVEWLYSQKLSSDKLALEGSTPFALAQSDWLIFLSFSSDSPPGDRGDFHPIGYRIAFSDPRGAANNKPFFALYRTVYPAKTAIERLVSGTTLKVYTTTDPPALNSSTMLAKNIVGFQIVFTIDDGRGSLSTCAASNASSVVATDKGVFHDGVKIGAGIASVQVKLSIIPGDTMEKLRADLPNATKERLMNQTAMVFSRPIPVSGRRW